MRDDTTGTTSGSRRPARWRATRLVAMAAVLALVLTTPAAETAAGEGGPDPTVTATPTEGLADGDTVTVSVREAEPGAWANVMLCEGSASLGCRGGASGHIDEHGAVDLSLVVRRIIPIVDSDPLDCAVAAGTCVLELAIWDGEGTFLTISLDFDPEAPLLPPATLALEPGTPVRDGEERTVRGDGFTPGWVTLEQCVVQAPGDDGEADCQWLDSILTDGDGSFEATVPLRRDVASLTHDPGSGYVWLGDGADGGYQHWLNLGFMGDGRVLDPERPESLVFYDGHSGPDLVSAMFLLPFGSTMDDIPEDWAFLPGWHVHDDICFAGLQLVGFTDEDGNCPPGSVAIDTPPMVHVWIIDTECGRFAGIDRDGVDCGHDHGHGPHHDPSGEHDERGFPPHWTPEQVAKAEALIADTEAALEAYRDVPAQVPSSGVARVDCAAIACELRAWEDYGGDRATASLEFDPGVWADPVVVTATPAEGLRGTTEVAVRAEGLSPGGTAEIVQCLGTPGPDIAGCDGGTAVYETVDESGVIETTFTARSFILNGQQPCAFTELACVVAVRPFGDLATSSVAELGFEGHAPVRVVPGSVEVVEGDEGVTVAELPVQLDRSSQAVVQADYRTFDVTATAGEDYVPTEGTVTFRPGQTEVTVPVEILGDTLFEHDEFVGVGFFGAVNATIGGWHGLGSVHILDDDPPPTLAAGAAWAGAGDDVLSVPLRLSEVAGRDVSVRASTVGLTARAGRHFVPVDERVTVPAGAAEVTVDVALVDGGPSRWFPRIVVVVLSAPDGPEFAEARDRIGLGLIGGR